MNRIEMIESMLNELIKKHLPSEWGYDGYVADTKKRMTGKGSKKGVLGFCSYTRKEICIDINHAKMSTLPEIVDTILHEIAHALAFHLYGSVGHDKKWRSECIRLGCTPRAKATVSDDLLEVYRPKKTSKWTIVYKKVTEGDIAHKIEVIKVGECNRKLVRMASRYDTKIGRETLGKLYLVDTKKYEAYNAGKSVLVMSDFVR